MTNQPQHADPLLRWFEFEHLPDDLQATSRVFHGIAGFLVATLPRCAERTVALRKMLEAKDAAVRAAIEGRDQAADQ